MPGRGGRQGVGERPRGVVGELLAMGGVAAIPATFSSKLIVAIVRIITDETQILLFKVQTLHVRLGKTL